MVSSQRNLLASTDVVSAELQGRFAGGSVNRDVNRTRQVATAGRGRDSIFMVRSGGRNGNHRVSLTIAPFVFHILIHKTVEIGVQRHSLALANAHLVGNDLEISTGGIDGEVSGGNTVRKLLRDRGGIDTGQIRGQCKTVTCLRTRPSN